MKVKYLLAALAMPALIVACSQEENVIDIQDQQTLLGKVAGDVDFSLAPESRLTWDANNNVSWDSEDGFSLFYVGDLAGAATNPLKGKVNALYKKEGNKFTSQNIVYEGNHIIVYPADYGHLSATEDIEVEVGAVQDNAIPLGKRSVWTLDSLLTIKAPLTDPNAKEDPRVIYAGGYGQPVTASLQALSSNLVLNLDFEMGKATEVKVKKVVLKSNNNVFSVNGKLQAEAAGVGQYNQHVAFVDGTPVNAVTLNMGENTTVTKNGGPLTVQFSLLPLITQTALTNATYSIEVHTNYGVVTVDEAKNVLARSKTVYCNSVSTAVGAEGGIPDANKALDLSDEIKLMSTDYQEDYDYRQAAANKGIKKTAYGYKMALDVTVKMEEASITGMEVANSDELIAAYDTYTLLGKTGNESFVLKSVGPFELTPAAVTKILGNKKISLEINTYYKDAIVNDSIKLVGAHTSIPQFNGLEGDVTNLFVEGGVAENPTLVLGAEGTWAIDVDEAAIENTWNGIVNAGTLTISQSNPKDVENALTKNIENRGTIKISGSVALPAITLEQTAGTFEVPATANLSVNNASTTLNINAGKMVVDGYMGVTDGTVNNTAETEVTGIINTTGGAFVNGGTIKLKDANAIVVISENMKATTVGNIELFARNSSVNVTGTEKGYIKWNCDVTEYTAAGDDTFNYAVLNGNLTVKSQGDLKYIEIAQDKKAIISSAIVDNNGDPVALELSTIIINKNATLVVPVGTTIEANLVKKTGANEPIILGTLVP